jgi:two-component system, response regulator YesN
MEQVNEELIRKCWMIHNAFYMDVELINEGLHTLLHISDDTMPSIIVENRKRMKINLQKTIIKAEKNSFCFHTDNFLLSYFSLAIRDHIQTGDFIIIGPFVNEKVSDQLIWNAMKKNKLENDWFKPLEIFYKSIPFVGESSFTLGQVLVNLCSNPYTETQIIPMHNVSSDRNSEVKPEEVDEDDLDIKNRYEIEKKLLHYVEIGDKENALKTFVHFTGNFLYRVPGNPLRARKNIAISYNTLLRLSANKGGVPPQYLHALSERIALKIEQAVTIQEVDTLEIDMTEEYCDLVANMVIKGHSSVIKKALNYINLHFHEPINLQSVADELGSNRTYLAKKFKEEMNMTVIEYIQQKRIKEAAFLIEQGRLSITEISYLVGFSSYNYFCKVFKDIKGMTATEYKKE